MPKLTLNDNRDMYIAAVVMYNKIMSNTVKIVAEGYASFDGVKLWEERTTLDFGYVSDAEFLTKLHAEALQLRYSCRLVRRGQTSWYLTEPGELSLWVRSYVVEDGADLVCEEVNLKPFE